MKNVCVAALCGLSILGAVILFSLGKAEAQNQSSLEAVQAQFAGNYELVKFVSFRSNGGVVENDSIGRLMYDTNGNMAAQAMPRDLPQRARETTENVRGGFAYFGKYVIDVEKNMVTHKVQGSPTRGSWVGRDNVRYYEFTGDLLTLRLKNAEGRVTGALTWKRFPQ